MSRLREIRCIAIFLGATCQIAVASPAEDLNAALVEHRAVISSADACSIVELHMKVDGLINSINKSYPSGESAKFFRPEYEEIGVSVGHYSEALEYSWSILAEAHAANSRSECREYTLFSEVGRSETDAIASPRSAEEYLREFPRGPYAAEAHHYIGSFYSDLVEYLAELDEGHGEEGGAGFQCYSAYVTEVDRSAQSDHARKLAIKHLEMARLLKKRRRQDPGSDYSLKHLKEGDSPHGYFLCPC